MSTRDSVAARRSLFESNNGASSPSPTFTKRTPLTSPQSGHRPSYMEHIKSSLEHIRRDSLEINKNQQSRKFSQSEEELSGTERNTAVKFEVPATQQHTKRPSIHRPPSTNEELNVEEIYDSEVLEKLLETIQSYEIRRRIRAQIRLVRKNEKNEIISGSSSTVVTTTTSTTKSSKPTMEAEEPDTTTTTTTKPTETPKQTSTKREYIFDEPYLPTSRKSLATRRYEKPEPKQHSPERIRENVSISRNTKDEYHYTDEYQQQEFKEIRHETSPTRKSGSIHSSPDRQHTSPTRNREPSRSPESRRKPSLTNVTTATTTSTITGSNKPLTKRVTTTTTTTTTTKGDKAPIWADRKNILKAPGTTTPKKPSSTSSTGYTTKSTKSSSSTSQKLVTNKSSSADDDCITSSYGIGPTDENGLPLFGIRALKKKKPQVEPSEITNEVTGYVVEETYYSDNKTKPTVERKEFIYSTNPDELSKLKEQAEVASSTVKSLKDVDVKETRQAALISKDTAMKGVIPALRSSPEADYLDSTTKYLRRGSVKEMSEKFIQKEASSSVLPDKSKNYPKAGLILRTNSRKNSHDNENEGDNYETYKSSSRVQHHYTTLGDSDGAAEPDYEVEEIASRHSGRFITESESECDSIKTQREVKSVTSTRSFLNSQGEEKIITNVNDCLERMRNADNVVEEGDTSEDQEARALLNKFLGASVIMKGVESSLPASNRESKIITTTTTSSCNLSDDNDDDDDDTAKHEIKTTRITKTIKSGNSSSPVTYTTCDIEEIWDEEILKELLEEARTYEERRKIRSRLRELMADREEQKQNLSSSTTEKTETKEEDGAVVTTTTKVTTRTITGTAAKPVSPFDKFKQLDSQQSAKSPTTPTTPGGGKSTASPTTSGGAQPIFKFTDPALSARAATVKDQLLQWCQSKTQEYENVQITNFSTSWNNGLAFCALIHHFLPDAFDYSQLTPKNRRKNFELAFTVADEKAGIAPLLDVEDMVVMQKPDWKCVFVYVQSIYRRFRNCQ